MFPTPYPTYPKLEVYFYDNTPVVVGEVFKIKIAFYDNEGILYDLSNSNLVTKVVWNGGENLLLISTNQLEATKAGSYRIQYSYSFQGTVYTYDFLFCAVVDVNLILGEDQIYKCIKREEPTGMVYSQEKNPKDLVYVDNTAVSKVVEKSYLYLAEQASNIFPEDVDPSQVSFIQNWLEMLTGEFDFYPPDTANLPRLIQFLRNAGYGGSPYELAFWISKYVYLRMGTSFYVYIEEFLYRQLDYWTLGRSQLGINTKLAPNYTPEQRSTAIIHIFDSNLIPETIRQEINYLLEHWGTAGVIYQINHGEYYQDFGLNAYLGQTYNGDPRAIGVVCIAYIPSSPKEVIGRTKYAYPDTDLVKITISPNSGTWPIGTNITFTVMAEYRYGFEKDITLDPEVTWSPSGDPSRIQVVTVPNVWEAIQDSGSGIVVVNYKTFVDTAILQLTP